MAIGHSPFGIQLQNGPSDVVLAIPIGVFVLHGQTVAGDRACTVFDRFHRHSFARVATGITACGSPRVFVFEIAAAGANRFGFGIRSNAFNDVNRVVVGIACQPGTLRVKQCQGQSGRIDTNPAIVVQVFLEKLLEVSYGFLVVNVDIFPLAIDHGAINHLSTGVELQNIPGLLPCAGVCAGSGGCRARHARRHGVVAGLAKNSHPVVLNVPCGAALGFCSDSRAGFPVAGGFQLPHHAAAECDS